MQIEDANLNLTDLRSRFDTGAYLSPHSDVVALLVFDHQLRMMNLLTRIGWEARTLAHGGRSEAAIVTALRSTAIETVDYCCSWTKRRSRASRFTDSPSRSARAARGQPRVDRFAIWI